MAVQTPNSAFNSNNLMAGSVDFYYGPLGTPAPSMPLTANAPLVVPAPWTKFGYTDAGITVAYQPAYKDIMADESMSALLKLKTGETLKCSAMLKEQTLENMQVALSGATFSEVQAGAGVADVATLDVGGSQAYTEYGILLVKPKGPYGFPRIINIYRCIPTANVSMAMKKDDVVMVPLEFDAMTYTPNPIGKQLFQMIEKRANATS